MQQRYHRSRMRGIGAACAASWAANELRPVGRCTGVGECEQRQWQMEHVRECSILGHHLVPNAWTSTSLWSTGG